MKEIKQLPISSLTLLEKNPRKISKDQMEKLCISIQEDPDFLQNRPVLVNKIEDKLVVYAGNQRVRAAKKLKYKTVPCIVDDNLPDPLLKSRIIKDNKQFGEFDWDLLGNEWDIDVLLACGFTPDDIVGATQDIHVVESEEKEDKQKECKMCPACGYEL